jgi:hypothetical protein
MAIIKSLGSLERILDKSGIIALGESDAQQVIGDEKFDLLKVYVEMKRYELYFKTVLEHLKDGALKKALSLGEKNIRLENANVTISERRVIDFDSDAKWQSIHGDIEYLKRLQKDRELLLKTLAPGETRQIVDPETGEMEELTAPPQKVVTGLLVKLSGEKD